MAKTPTAIHPQKIKLNFLCIPRRPDGSLFPQLMEKLGQRTKLCKSIVATFQTLSGGKCREDLSSCVCLQGVCQMWRVLYGDVVRQTEEKALLSHVLGYVTMFLCIILRECLKQRLSRVAGGLWKLCSFFLQHHLSGKSIRWFASER